MPDPAIKRPTRPRNPAPKARRGTLSPALRKVHQQPAPQPISIRTTEEKVKHDAAMRRRTARPTFDEIAAMVAGYRQSTDQLSEGLAARYSLTDTERLQHRTIIRAMRVAQRHLIMQVRREYPLGATLEQQQTFLEWFQGRASEIKARASDNPDQ